MKKSMVALTIMALFSSSAVFAGGVGGSSNNSNVQAGTSDHPWFNTGNSGLKLSGSDYFIDLADGPIRGSNAAIAENGNGGYMWPKHVVSWLPVSFPNIAQVWKATEISTDPAFFVINSIRQITNVPLSLAPKFGGLVIGQVGNPVRDGSGNVIGVNPLSTGSGVYFGEWAKGLTSPAASGADLNMTDASRTVWYVGDNAVTTMPTAVSATYSVIGINQTGTNASGTTLAGGLPGSPNLYTGTLTAAYASGTGSLTGSMTRGGSTLNFTGVTINSNGTFNNAIGLNNVEGRFYNGAEQLAGIHKAGSGVADDVAFGGSKVSGTITP